MKANNDKFQLIVFDRPGLERPLAMNVGESIIQTQPGLHVASLLSFNAHVDEICRKAGRKLNVLASLSKTMSTECKLMLFYSLIAAQFEYCNGHMVCIYYFILCGQYTALMCA